MTTLITGGTGFTGAEVVRLLMEQGEDNLVLFDINPSTKRLVRASNHLEIVQGDLGNFDGVMDLVEHTRPSVIYHLGGMLSVPSDADHVAAIRTNALGTFHVLEAARQFGVQKVLFSSTHATYGLDIREESVNDYTLQRPQLIYGATKLFGEHMGLFFKKKFGLDFRSIRYPSIVGPGVKTRGVAQYNSWVIEESSKGNPFTVWVRPETRIPVIYVKDAARAIVTLGKAPVEKIRTINYLVSGAPPVASAGELSEMVKARLPDARIDFKPDPEIQDILDKLVLPIDDSNARGEWGWEPEYDQARIVDDFLNELKQNPGRYE